MLRTTSDLRAVGGRVPNLVSAVLAQALRSLPNGYLAVYGH
jgi:hypothetical protein